MKAGNATSTLVLALALLAGCSDSSPPVESSSSTDPQSSSESAILVYQVPAVTDRLFLADGDEFSIEAPASGTCHSKALPVNGFILPGTVDRASWSFTAAEARPHMETNGTLWIEIVGTVVNAEGSAGAADALFLTIFHEDDQGSSASGRTAWPQSGQLSPGVHEVQVDFSAPPNGPAKGASVRVEISSRAHPVDPDSSISVKFGCAEAPSQLTMQGLAMPLES